MISKLFTVYLVVLEHNYTTVSCQLQKCTAEGKSHVSPIHFTETLSRVVRYAAADSGLIFFLPSVLCSYLS